MTPPCGVALAPEQPAVGFASATDRKAIHGVQGLRARACVRRDTEFDPLMRIEALPGRLLPPHPTVPRTVGLRTCMPSKILCAVRRPQVVLQRRGFPGRGRIGPPWGRKGRWRRFLERDRATHVQRPEGLKRPALTCRPALRVFAVEDRLVRKGPLRQVPYRQSRRCSARSALLSEVDEARLDAEKLPQPCVHAPVASLPLLPGPQRTVNERCSLRLCQAGCFACGANVRRRRV